MFSRSLPIDAKGFARVYVQPLLSRLQSGIRFRSARSIRPRPRRLERKQKHDRRDAALLLKLPVENRFPSMSMVSAELRDLRALLRHRHQWVYRGTRVQNTLQAIVVSSAS